MRGGENGCTGETGEEQAPESQSELISLACGVPGLSETALLAFNLLLDTMSRSSEQGGFQSQASLCVFYVFFFCYHPVFGQLLV